MAAVEQHLQLARALPLRLQRFFAINKPQHFTQAAFHNPAVFASPDGPVTALPVQARAPPNPFKPNKDPRSGRWHPPIYSLRQQAELVKLAKRHGVEDLLPHTVKSTSERQKQREEHGLRVQGTGAGQRVKGHLWERTLKGRLEKRRQAMLRMPKMIEDWRQVWRSLTYPI